MVSPASSLWVFTQTEKHGTYLGLGLLCRGSGRRRVRLLLIAARALLLLFGQRGGLVRVGTAEEPGSHNQ